MRVLACVGVVWLCVLSTAGASYAIYETPMSKTGCQIEPYAPVFGRMLDALQDRCEEQLYKIDKLIELAGLDLTPEVTLPDFVARLENGDGVFGWATGRGLIGLAVEAYEFSQSGYYACEAAYERYLTEGYATDEIAPDWHGTDGYHIAVKPALISRRYRSANSIVYVGACNSMSYASSWAGAREVLGYSGTVSTSTVQSEANTFWSRMNGEHGKTYRYVGGARSGLTLVRSGSGNGDTVLSPTVESYYPSEGSWIYQDSVPGAVVFDTRMNLGVNPADLVDGNTHLLVGHEEWSRGERDTLKYILKSVIEGTGKVIASGESEGGIILDGNTSPYWTDGIGPNGDPYEIGYICNYTDPNYAARFGPQWAYLDAGEVVVGWCSEAEIGTREYVVEAGDGSDWTLGWDVVGRVGCKAENVLGTYSVRVPAGYRFYRVVELDGSGKRCESRPVSARAGETEDVKMIMNAAGSLGEGASRTAAIGLRCARSAGSLAGQSRPLDASVPTWVFYGPDSLLAECGPAVAWLEGNGLDVDIVAAVSPDY